MSRLPWLLRRAKRLLQTEGLIPLVRQALAFMVKRFFQYRTLYLCETDLLKKTSESEANFLPRIQHFTFKVVSTNEEADELEANGFEFRSCVGNARNKLDKGAIAFCIFIGQEFAHYTCGGMTQQAKDVLEALPYRVDFSNNEVCSGRYWTNPKYRGMGLGTYGAFKMHQFMGERGKVVSRGSVAKDNIASHRAAANVNTKICAEARYLKILWWKWWKEKPLPQPNGE